MKSLLFTLFNIMFLLPILIIARPPPNANSISYRDDGDDAKSKSNFDVGALFNSTSPLGQLLGPLGGALSAFLGKTGNPTVQNELKSAVATNGTGACPAMSVIFARGTAEPGNVGILTGPPFFAAIGAYMNGTGILAIQGVDYDASISGFLAGGSSSGAQKMASLINSTFASCPKTMLTLSGYSQGAQLVHLATSSLPVNTTSKIASVVLFGDPKNGTAINGVDASKVLTVCHAGDNICAGGDKIGLAHLNYSADAGGAAMFALGGVAMLGITSASMKKVLGVNSLGE